MVVATYLTWIAGRVDRSHARARHPPALRDALNNRADAATRLATAVDPDHGALDPHGGGSLAALASAARGADPKDPELENALTKALRDLPVNPDDPVVVNRAGAASDGSMTQAGAASDTTVAQADVASDATRAQSGKAAPTVAGQPGGAAPGEYEDRESVPADTLADALAEVVATSRRVALARHIHTDLVRDALAMRRRRVVRLMRMTRKHAVPAYFDIEDPTL